MSEHHHEHHEDAKIEREYREIQRELSHVLHELREIRRELKPQIPTPTGVRFEQKDEISSRVCISLQLRVGISGIYGHADHGIQIQRRRDLGGNGLSSHGSFFPSLPCPEYCLEPHQETNEADCSMEGYHTDAEHPMHEDNRQTQIHKPNGVYRYASWHRIRFRSFHPSRCDNLRSARVRDSYRPEK